MLHRLLSRVNRLVGRSNRPPIRTIARSSPDLRFRPALQPLDERVVPANLAWTNVTGNGLFDVAANWRNLSTGLPSVVPPAPNDHLTFDGTITHADLMNLHGFNLPESVPDFASISFINGYSGTVTIMPDGSGGLSAATYVMNTGAIAQPIPGTDLSVLGAFNWTGGVLNSTPSTATVNIYGGGSIVLPGVGNTLTTGSTLNFASFGGEQLTTITGGGNLLLNGLNDNAMFVGADAGVQLVVDPNAETWIKDQAGKKLTILQGSKGWKYVGSGDAKLDLRVFNQGGFFVLDGQIHLRLTGGTTGPSPALSLPSYTNEDNQFAFLHITNGCVLDAAHGVRISGGSIFLIMKPGAPQAEQVATFKGTLEMLKGDIVFSEPIVVNGESVFGWFRVEGDVVWSGGTYRPCIEVGTTKANRWQVTGTMAVDASNPTNKPRIELNYPPGQQPTGTWLVIEADGQNAKLQGDDPLLPDGWNLVTHSSNGVKKKWSVNK